MFDSSIFLRSHRLRRRLHSSKTEGNFNVWRLLRRHDRLHAHGRHLCHIHSQRVLPSLAGAPHSRIIRPIHSHKPLRQKTLRPSWKVSRQRPLHRHHSNPTVAESGNLQLRAICIPGILCCFAYKPHSKPDKKKSLKFRGKSGKDWPSIFRTWLWIEVMALKLLSIVTHTQRTHTQ